MQKHAICSDCLFNDASAEDVVCGKCIPGTRRSNFISVFREGGGAEIDIDPPYEGPQRLYKVLYKDPQTGEWFYENNTPDHIGHHSGFIVEDILDIL